MARRQLIRQFDRRATTSSQQAQQQAAEPQGVTTGRKISVTGYTRSMEGGLVRYDSPVQSYVSFRDKQSGQDTTSSYIPRTVYMDRQGRVVQEIVRGSYQSESTNKRARIKTYIKQINEYYSDGSVKRVQRFDTYRVGSSRRKTFRESDVSYAGGQVARQKFETKPTPKKPTAPTPRRVTPPKGTTLATTTPLAGGGTQTVTRSGKVTIRNAKGKIIERYIGELSQTAEFLRTQSKAIRDAVASKIKQKKILTATQMIVEVLKKQGKKPTVDSKGNVQYIEGNRKTLISPYGQIVEVPKSAKVSQSVFDLTAKLKAKVSQKKLRSLLKKQALQKEMEAGNFVQFGNVVTVIPKNAKEKKFYDSLKKVIERDERLKAGFQATFDKLNLNVKEADKWYIKAVKGAGQLGVATAFIGAILGNAVDKAIISGKGLLSTANIRQAVKEESVTALKKVPGEVGRQVDPRKPENWAGIALIVGSIALAPGAFLRVGSRLRKNYVPSVRNLAKMKTGFLDARTKVNVAINLARKGVKAKVNLGFNKSLLRRLLKTRAELNKGIIKLTSLEKNPKILKLADMNPLIKSADLIKTLRKEQNFFHATSAKVSDLFGQKFTKIKSEKAILEAVKAATKPRRIIVPKTETGRLILSFARRNRGVVGGSNAQNIFVRKGLTRLAKDFDLLMPSPKANAVKLVNMLKKKYPNANVRLIKTKNAYKIRFNGKDLVDIVKLPKGLKTVKVGKDIIIDVTELAKGKIKTLKDFKLKFREVKDVKDLRRLVGDFFSDRKFLTELKDPKNYFRVKAQPKGMGASRIKFSETQLFFDLEVPTAYAYNSLVKNLIPKPVLTFAKKIGFKKSFINRLDALKTIKASDRIIVLQLKTKTATFPRNLQKRIKMASRGKLTERQQNVLRQDLNVWINKNPGKVSIGSRTASRPLGEREVVLPVNSVLKAVKRKISIDPETNLFIDVIQTTTRLKKVPQRTLKTLVRDMKRFIREAPQNIKLKFSSGDVAKMRRFKRVLKRADDLTTRDTLFFENIVQKMFKSRKGVKRRVSIKGKKKKVQVRRKRKVVVKMRKGKVVPKVVRRTTPRKVKRKAARKIVRPVKRPVKRVVKRVTKRPVKRPVKRVAKRPVKRPTKRITPRTRVRPTTRVTPRARVTPRRRPVRKVVKPRPKQKPPIKKMIKFSTFARGKPVDVYVKKQGAKARYVRINKKPLAYKDAVNMGRYVTDNLPLASFRLKISSRKAKPMKFGIKTRPGKFRKVKGRTRLPSETKVERRKHRLDRSGEKTGITLRGIRAARNAAQIRKLIGKKVKTKRRK